MKKSFHSFLGLRICLAVHVTKSEANKHGDINFIECRKL